MAALRSCLIFSAVILFSAHSGALADQPGLGNQGVRFETGGAQTLDDILARQRGERIGDAFRSANTGDPGQAAGLTEQLGPLGGVSDADLWRAVRYGSADIIASTQTPGSTLLVQDGGMPWVKLRAGPLSEYGGYLLLGMIAVLAVYYLIRGRIRIEGEKAGETFLRFSIIERVSHWLLAISFIVLGLTGLITLFGRVALIPIFGKEAFSTLAWSSKWLHNNVAWVFMVSLVLVFVCWIRHNIPNRVDLKWLAKGGGLFTKGVHPPAKKFNAGQKIIFWIVIILGASISASGLALLLPFELPMFAATFQKLNALGISALLGMDPLPETLTPYQEMQFSQLWHSIVAFVFMAVIIAHIYLGSIGMEGAFDAMGTGKVDRQWAKEHHSLWYEEEVAKAESTESAKSDTSEDTPAVPAE